MEEHPELSPPEATRRAMAQITGPDHRHHPGAAVGVRADRLHSRSVRRAVPPVRGHHLHRHADLGAERADPVAGAVRRVPAAALAPSGACSVASWRRSCGPSTGCATAYARIVARLLGFAIGGVLVVVACGAIIALLSRTMPAGFLPEEDQGGFFINVQLPDGASVSRTSGVVAQVEKLARFAAGCGPHVRRDRLLFPGHRAGTQRRLRVRPAGTVRRPRQHAEERDGADRAPVRFRPRGCARRPCSRSTCRRSSACRRAAASNTSWKRSRVSRRNRSRRRCRACWPPPTRPASWRAPSPPSPRQHAVTVSRHRPRQGRSARRQRERHLHRAPDDAGRQLRQRLQPVWPGVAGQCRGRGARSRQDRRFVADLHPQQRRQHRAAAGAGDAAHRHRSAGHHPLQQLPCHHHQRHPGAGRVVRHRAGDDGRRLGAHAPERLRLRMDQHRVSGGPGQRQDRHHPGDGAAVRIPVPGGAVRKLDHPDPGAAVGGGRRAGRVPRHPAGRPVARPLCPDRGWWC